LLFPFDAATRMLLNFLALGSGLVVLYFGAERLVHGAASLALRFGLTPLVVGLTVVAFGTSAPELVVSVGSALGGRGGLAVGNVVGSNIVNTALILGLSVLIRPAPVKTQLLRLDVPLLVGVSVLLVGLLYDGVLSRADGALLTAGLVGYTGFNVWQSRRERAAVQADLADALPTPTGSWARDAAWALAGLVLLVVGAQLLVTGAVAIAEAAGLSEAVIGLTVIAIGTSLPELATTVVAALRGEGDIAVGNVVGSNVFNLLGILGVAALVTPLERGGVALFDLGAMLFLTLLLVPLMRSGFQLARWEGGLLLGCYVAYLAVLLT
jgi:cation:H+ antiporter